MSLGIYAYDRLSVRLAEMNPRISEIDLNTVDIRNLLIFETVFDCLEKSVNVKRRRQLDLGLEYRIVGIFAAQLADLTV